MHYLEDYLIEDREYSLYKLNPQISDIPQDIRDAVSYLRKYANFCYTDNVCQDNPFHQLYSFVDGPESIKIEELTSEQIDRLKAILPLTKHPFILAKICDIIGIASKDAIYQRQAAGYYEKFFRENLNIFDFPHILYISLKRAIFLYHKSNKNGEGTFVEAIFKTIHYNTREQEVCCKYYAAVALSEIKSKLIKNIIPYLEVITTNYDRVFVTVYIDLLEILISYYSSTHQKDECYHAVDRYVSFCQQASSDFSPYGYEYIDKAISVLSKDQFKEDYDSKINELLFLKEKFHGNLFDSLNMVEHPLDEKLSQKLDQAHQLATEKINSFQSGDQQFLCLLHNFVPVKKTELDKYLENSENSLFNCVNEILFNDDHCIIYESATASEDEKRQVKTAQYLQLDLQVKFSIFLSTFIYNLKVDDSLKTIIADILANNLFVPDDRKTIVSDIIINGFNKNIRKAVYDLISQFEYGLKLYLKEKNKYPVMYRGSHKVEIDTNHMLTNDKKQNKFRETIAEIIGEDLTLTLEYLLCNRFSGNIRNKNYHSGYGDPNQFTIYEAAAFYFIVETYCKGCN